MPEVQEADGAGRGSRDVGLTMDIHRSGVSPRGHRVSTARTKTSRLTLFLVPSAFLILHGIVDRVKDAVSRRTTPTRDAEAITGD